MNKKGWTLVIVLIVIAAAIVAVVVMRHRAAKVQVEPKGEITNADYTDPVPQI